MARVPEVTRRNPLVQERGRVIDSGQAFQFMAGVMGEASQILRPMAIEEQQIAGQKAVYRDDTGALKVDERSLLGGEMAQVHNAAAHGAFLAQAEIDMRETFSGMARDYDADPEGFRKAADSYISSLRKSAPAALSQTVSVAAREQALSVFNGIAAKEIQRGHARFADSTAALRDRLAIEKYELVVAGDGEGAAAKQSEIDAINAARRSNPYIGESAEEQQLYDRRLEDRALAGRVSRLQTQAQDVIALARQGLTDANEAAVLADLRALASSDNPIVAEDGRRALEAFSVAVDVKNFLPAFSRLTPAEQATTIQQVKDGEIGGGQVAAAMVGEMEQVAAQTAQAVARDPLSVAARSMPLDGIDPMDPQSLSLRRTQATAAARAGYNPAGRLFTESEVSSLKQQIAGATASEKAQLAGSMVAGFGPDAARAIAEVDADGVFDHAGYLLASGASRADVEMMFAGEGMQEKKKPNVETRAIVEGEFVPQLTQAVDERVLRDMLPGVQKAALAYFAASPLPGGDPDDFEDGYRNAMSAAVGRNLVEIGGGYALLPPGSNPDLTRATFEGLFSAIAPRRERTDTARAARDAEGRALFNETWAQSSVGGGHPVFSSGDELTASDVNSVRMVMVQDGVYELRYVYDDVEMHLSDSATKQPFRFRIRDF